MSKRWVEILNAKNEHGYVSIIFVESLESNMPYFQAKTPGLVFVSGGDIIEFKTVFKDILLIDHQTANDAFDLDLNEDEEFEYFRHRCFRSDVSQFHLESKTKDSIFCIGEVHEGEAYQGYMESYEKNVILLGVMPKAAFFKEHHYGYTGGAHGWEYSQFHVVDLDTLSEVDFWTSVNPGDVLTVDFDKWSKELISKGAYFTSDDSKESVFQAVELTTTYPSFDGSDIVYNYQVTSGSCYAASDSGWGDYTVSTTIQTQKRHSLYQNNFQSPKFVDDFLFKYFGSLTFLGWTTSLLEVEQIEHMLGKKLNDLIPK